MISRLHYISQSKSSTNHLIAIENALRAGCKWIQLRMKNASLEDVLETAIAARTLCNQSNAKLIINDYPEVALASRADGLHLGLLDMGIKEAKAIVGDKLIIGGTANTFEDILLRVAEGADYIGLGPFRFTETKKNLSPILGLEGYQKLVQRVKKHHINTPLIAIGGIELADVATILQTGIYGVAISGAITYAQNRTKVVEEIFQEIERNKINTKELSC